MATVYFVKHGLDEYRGVPGRYPFVVSASALERASSATYVPATFSGTIYADALAAAQPAGNVDPNVFSDVLPWFHAYCLIDKRNQKRVLPGGRLLPEAAAIGDVVVYGGHVSKHILFIDTIIRVGGVATLPQVRGSFCLQSAFGNFRASVGLPVGLSWPEFAVTASYRLNLVDSMPGRRHHRAHIDPHQILVGTRDAADGPVEATALLELFLRGEGFNCIPLAHSQDSENKSVAARPDLFVKRYHGAFSAFASGVNALSAADGRGLLRMIFSAADRLILDPLRQFDALSEHNPAERES